MNRLIVTGCEVESFLVDDDVTFQQFLINEGEPFLVQPTSNIFESFVFDTISSDIEKTKLGFVNDDCNLFKSIIKVMCIHALDNFDIFGNEQSNNIINLINLLSHGK